MSITKINRGRSFFAFLSGLFLLFLLSPAVPAATPEIEGVREQIRNKGANWLSDETSITKLPVERRLKRLGLVKGQPLGGPETTAVLNSSQTAAKSKTTPPTYLNYYDYNYVTPIRDQGDCGSCWAFAATAALESQVLIGSAGAGASTLDLSEQVLLSCSGAGSCAGGYIDYASEFIQGTGLPPESCFPYTAADNSCSNAQCPYWQSETDAIKGWGWVALTSPTAAVLKSALRTYGPLVTTMNVYSDFYSYAGGIYSHVSGTIQGGHAVAIVGYDDTNQCFIVKNSWGTGWGENGFFRIAYSELKDKKHVQFGYFTIAYTGHTPVQNACSYTVSPSSITVTYTGGSANVNVTSQSGCSWTAVSNVSWITVATGASGADDGPVSYQVSANNTHSSRTGKLNIAGKTITVKQKGKPAGLR